MAQEWIISPREPRRPAGVEGDADPSHTFAAHAHAHAGAADDIGFPDIAVPAAEPLTTHHETVAEFLTDAVRASTASGYPCLAVLIARTADARALQRQLWEDHFSIHDVTGRHILIILPYKNRGDRHGPVPGVQVPAEAAEVRAGSLTMPAGTPQDWATAFWTERIRRLDGHPGKLADHHRRGTETARETREFFGVPEQMLPCLALTLLWEQQVRILRLGSDANLYRLLSDVVAEWEKTAPSSGLPAPGPVSSRRMSFGACLDRVMAARRYELVKGAAPLRMPQFPDWQVQVWQQAGLSPARPGGERS